MRETITRKQFLLLGVGAAATALVPGCGDDGNTDTGGSTGSSDTDTASASTTDSTTASTTNSTTASTTDSTTASTTASTTDSSTTTDPGSSSGGDPTTDGSGSSGAQDSSGGSSSDGGSSSGGMAGCDAAPTAMFDLHVHALNIPLADVMAGVDHDYVVGVMGHMHTVSVTAEDFATLQESGQVIVMGSAGGIDNHTHMVTLTCA